MEVRPAFSHHIRINIDGIEASARVFESHAHVQGAIAGGGTDLQPPPGLHALDHDAQKEGVATGRVQASAEKSCDVLLPKGE